MIYGKCITAEKKPCTIWPYYDTGLVIDRKRAVYGLLLFFVQKYLFQNAKFVAFVNGFFGSPAPLVLEKVLHRGIMKKKTAFEGGHKDEELFVL